MSRRAAQLAVALLALLASSGCFSLSGRCGAPIPLERVLEIRAGETTREQITAWFGPPSALPRPFDGLLNDWLAGSPYCDRNGAMFELYPEDPRNGPDGMAYEIWMQVERGA